jgi:tRNA pseudouridine55 synthase
MDGVLLIDKPSGPTSHDVVARVRRSSGERRIGHTGTLDPRATGLLPLVLGRATRLASRIMGGLKTYDAVVRLGFATDTDDADGQPIGEVVEAAPGIEEIDAALADFRGTFDQMPPDHSAKKVGGKKAYDLARRAEPVILAPATVTVHELTYTGRSGPDISLTVTATSGFYVRSLARDVGRRLGCGGHLESLRRTRSGTFDVSVAISLESAERDGPGIGARLISPGAALPHLPSVTLTEVGLGRALHGNTVGPDHLAERWLPPPGAGEVRLLGPDGALVALAHSRGGALHPVVVLG